MIAVIDCCGSNKASVQFALERLGVSATFTCDPHMIQTASRVILPGVGQAGYAMIRLASHHLTEVIPTLKQPVLGICLGMQLLFEHSEEGNVDCLGIISGNVKALSQVRIVPHMGWNTLSRCQTNHPLLKGIGEQDYVYFVHSYAAPLNDYTLTKTHYGNAFTSIVSHNNFYGMQFHPEKSGAVGETLLKNFLEMEL